MKNITLRLILAGGLISGIVSPTLAHQSNSLPLGSLMPSAGALLPLPSIPEIDTMPWLTGWSPERSCVPDRPMRDPGTMVREPGAGGRTS
jgi:hypothetical protein